MFSPALLVIGPVWILLAARLLFGYAPILAFVCLSLLFVVPLGLVLFGFGIAPNTEGRLVSLHWAAASLVLGLLVLPFCYRDLNPEGFRRSQVERVIARCESTSDPVKVRTEFATLNHHDYTLLNRKDHRRAAIQKARFGDWNGALLLWALNGDPFDTEQHNAVATLLQSVKNRGVSQFLLKSLCTKLFWMGFKKESVVLWRSHYPGVIPADWSQALTTY